MVFIGEYLVYIVAAILSIALYIVSSIFIFRHIIRVLEKEMLIVARIAMGLLSISLFLAFIASLHGVHEIFILVFSLFIISFLAVIVGARHVLEEYMTGVFASKAYDLRAGDYIEIRDIRGYVAALDDTSIIIRDPKKGLVYIPYTMLAHTPFKRVKIEEGYEMRVILTIPLYIDLQNVRTRIEDIVRGLGVENPRVDIDSIGSRGLRLVVRGSIRDPRRGEEIRLALLDRLYPLLRFSISSIEDKPCKKPDA